MRMSFSHVNLPSIVTFLYSLYKRRGVRVLTSVEFNLFGYVYFVGSPFFRNSMSAGKIIFNEFKFYGMIILIMLNGIFFVLLFGSL